MRITVLGDGPAAAGLRGMLAHEGLQLVAELPLWTIELQELPDLEYITFDTVDSDLERHIVNQVSGLAPGGRVMLARGGGNQDDRRIVIRLPAGDDAASYAVQVGVLRGMLRQARLPGAEDLGPTPLPAAKEKPWYRFGR